MSGVEQPKEGERGKRGKERKALEEKKKEGKNESSPAPGTGHREKVSRFSAGDQSGYRGPPDGIEVGVHVPTLSIGRRTLWPPQRFVVLLIDSVFNSERRINFSFPFFIS